MCVYDRDSVCVCVCSGSRASTFVYVYMKSQQNLQMCVRAIIKYYDFIFPHYWAPESHEGSLNVFCI